MAGLTAARLAYGSGAWGHPASGTPASLPRIRQADLVALHRATFRPDRAVLILTGDIGPERAPRPGPRALRHLGRGRRASRRRSRRPPPTLAGGPAVAVVDMPAAGQAGVVLALPLPPRQGAERAAADVLDAVLGGGYSSRLNQEIRIKRGLSYAVLQPDRGPRPERPVPGGAADQERVRGRGRLAAPGRARPGDAGAGARRRAGVAQALADRRLQPQRRDHRRAGLGDPLAGGERALAGRAEDADRGDRGGRPGRRAALCGDPLRGRRAGASRWPASPSGSPARCGPTAPGLVVVGQQQLDLERADGLRRD